MADAGALATQSLFDLGSTALEYDSATKQGQFKEKQDLENIDLAKLQAADAYQRGGQLAGRLQMQASQLAAAQRLAFANSGVDAKEGTPVDVMAGTGALSELDVQTTLNNAAREAYGFKVRQLQLEQQLAQDQSQTDTNQKATLLGGAGKYNQDASGSAMAGFEEVSKGFAGGL
jgi:hypothetical protein